VSATDTTVVIYPDRPQNSIGLFLGVRRAADYTISALFDYRLVITGSAYGELFGFLHG